MILLFTSEIRDYLTPQLTEELFVDTSRSGKLKINFDIVFNRISCDYLVNSFVRSCLVSYISIELKLFKWTSIFPFLSLKLVLVFGCNLSKVKFNENPSKWSICFKWKLYLICTVMLGTNLGCTMVKNIGFGYLIFNGKFLCKSFLFFLLHFYDFFSKKNTSRRFCFTPTSY